MKAEGTLRVATFLLLLTGAAAVLLTGELGLPFTLLVVGAMVFCWFSAGKPVSSYAQVPVVVLLLVFFSLDLLLSLSIVLPTVRLLLLLGLFKLWTLKGGRDYLQVYLIAFSLLLIAATFTMSITYLVFAVIFLYLSVLTLILFESRHAYRQNPSAPFPIRVYGRTALVLTCLIALLAIPIFLAVPRATLGLFRGAEPNLSGFSNRVELGDIGRILRNSQLVMRVLLDRDPEELPVNPKWRGIALDHYDGSNWINTRVLDKDILPRRGPGLFEAGTTKRGANLVRQEILLEPVSDVVFGAPDMVQIALPQGWRAGLLRDGNNSINFQTLFGWRQRTRYFVHSDIRSREEQARNIAGGEIPEEIRRYYLQLPEIDLDISGLARSLTREESDPFHKALALEKFLRRNFGYTLDNPSGGHADPLAHFLLQSRAGHCEYFATAQAVMMRTLGIPSRVVNGFHSGAFNEWRQHFTVRQSDAHSWVEGFFPGAGWIEFDPTPAVGANYPAGLAGLVNQITDSLDFFWTQLVTFNRYRQAGFFRSLGREVRNRWDLVLQGGPNHGLERVLAATRNVGLFHLVILLPMVAAAFLGYRFRRYLMILFKRHVLKENGGSIAPVYYQDMLDVLRRKGFRRSSTETPYEFSLRVCHETGSSIPAQITSTYYENRYGGRPLGRDDLNRIYSALRDLRRA